MVEISLHINDGYMLNSAWKQPGCPGPSGRGRRLGELTGNITNAIDALSSVPVTL